jgi:putative transposase
LAIKNAFNRLLLLLAQASDRQLAKHVQYLKVENRILRDKLPTRIRLSPREKQRLVKFGKPLGAGIRDLITIVSPRTFQRWLAGDKPAAEPAKTGRPRTQADLRELVLRLACENAWGYTRILGELKKLGLAHICRSTIVNILREAGIDTAPKRGEGTWDDFVRRHAATLWACDFFTKKVWTLGGPVSFFVLFVIHIGTRRVHIAGMTAHPNEQWMAEQAGQVAQFFATQPDKPTHLIRDLDTKFTTAFDAAMKSAGVTVVPVGPRAPNLNAFSERVVLSIKSECLDHFVAFGEAHLHYLVQEYLAHYHTERPHQGKDNLPLTGDPSPPRQEPAAAKVVEREQRLGGLLNHYRRAA